MFSGDRVSVSQDGKGLGMDGGDGDTSVYVPNATELHAYEWQVVCYMHFSTIQNKEVFAGYSGPWTEHRSYRGVREQPRRTGERRRGGLLAPGRQRSRG